MDPNWTECPYCAAVKEAAPKRPEIPDGGGKPLRDKTHFETDEPRRPERVTRLEEEVAPERAFRDSPRQEPTSRIVGALFTYSWDPNGHIYPIREGKNYVGKGESREGIDCEVFCPQDNHMSDEHALILYRHGKFDLYDQQSTNGTFLDGHMVNQAELKTFARLKVGKTDFLFVTFFEKLPPPQGEPFKEPVAQQQDTTIR